MLDSTLGCRHPSVATAASHYHRAVLLPPTNDSVSRPTLSNPTAHHLPTTIANYGRRHRSCLPVKLSHLFAGAKHGAGAHIPPQPPSPDGRGAGDRNGSRRGFIIASTRLTASNKKKQGAQKPATYNLCHKPSAAEELETAAAAQLLPDTAELERTAFVGASALGSPGGERAIRVLRAAACAEEKQALPTPHKAGGRSRHLTRLAPISFLLGQDPVHLRALETYPALLLHAHAADLVPAQPARPQMTDAIDRAAAAAFVAPKLVAVRAASTKTSACAGTARRRLHYARNG